MQKKFLCVCEGGTCRSVALAYVLKNEFKQDAVAASWRWNSSEVLEMLAAWADYIILMQPWELFSNGRHKDKVRVLDVGPDKWFNPLSRDLQDIVGNAAQGWSGKGFNI